MTEVFEEIIKIFDLTMTVPTPYGIFHIGALIASALICYLLCVIFKSPSEKTVRRILFAYAMICILLEIYKQISFTFQVENDVITHTYQWYAFPFQFCSMPMYVALIASLIRNEKLYSAFLAFLSTFGMIAGVLVMAVPTDVFIGTIGVNFQTMIHHGGQIVIGLFLIIRAGSLKKFTACLGGILIFIAAVTTAMILNLTMIHVIPEGSAFNMFYISPHFDCMIPVYDKLQDKLPYPVFLLSYLVPFIAVSFGIYAAANKLPQLFSHSKKTSSH